MAIVDPLWVSKRFYIMLNNWRFRSTLKKCWRCVVGAAQKMLKGHCLITGDITGLSAEWVNTIKSSSSLNHATQGLYSLIVFTITAFSLKNEKRKKEWDMMNPNVSLVLCYKMNSKPSKLMVVFKLNLYFYPKRKEKWGSFFLTRKVKKNPVNKNQIKIFTQILSYEISIF